MASSSFSIDDAFESDDDEKIRVYGSTKATSPLQRPACLPQTHRHTSHHRHHSGEVMTTSPIMAVSSAATTTADFVDRQSLSSVGGGGTGSLIGTPCTTPTSSGGPGVVGVTSSTTTSAPGLGGAQALNMPQETDEASASLIIKSCIKKPPGHRVFQSSSMHSVAASYTEETAVSPKSVQNLSWYKHPKIRENWKVVLGSLALTLIGSALLLAGLSVAITYAVSHSIVLFIAGLICFIPGVYHVVYIYCALQGRMGFSLYNLHVFK